MDLAVILPAHNEEAVIGEQLTALVNQEFPGEWEIVVVDNNSTDGTSEVVNAFAESCSRVRLVAATARADKSYAVEVGVAATPAPLLAFCDADDIVGDGWVAAIAAGLEHHEVVTGPNLLDRLNPKWLAESRGRSAENAIGSFHGLFPTLRGNNYGVRREVFDRIGALSHGYYPVEDLEFSYRCAKNGIDIVGLPGAVVHYRYRAEARLLWRQGTRYGAGRVRVASLLKADGAMHPPRLAGWRSWIQLLLTLPQVVRSPGRLNWLWIAANRWGQVVGSFRYRTLFL